MGVWLDKTGLSYFLGKLKSNIKITETRYSYTTSSSEMVSFTIPNYTPSNMVLDVYINGLHVSPTIDYTLSGNKITMVNQLDAGQVCDFVVRKVSF